MSYNSAHANERQADWVNTQGTQLSIIIAHESVLSVLSFLVYEYIHDQETPPTCALIVVPHTIQPKIGKDNVM